MKKKSLVMVVAMFVISLSLVAQKTGTFTDVRDGKIYKKVQIGTQVWMAENLAYKASSGCWAYDNILTNVAKYGYLYSWETAKTACPAGWHLPSKAEWEILTDFLGGDSIAGSKLKSSKGADGTTIVPSKSGFAAVMGGCHSTVNGTFIYLGTSGYWWCSTEIDNKFAVIRALGCDAIQLDTYEINKETGFSVRCVKNL